MPSNGGPSGASGTVIRSRCPTPCSTGNASLVASNSTHSSHAGSVTSRSFRLCTVQVPWMKSKSRCAGRGHGADHRTDLRQFRRTRAGSLCTGAAAGRTIRAWSCASSSNRIPTPIRRTPNAWAGSCATSSATSTWTTSSRSRAPRRRTGRSRAPLASLTEWLVTLSGGGGVVAPVIGTIKAWLARGAGAHKVTVTIDGDTLELGRATDAERAEIVDAFVRRHQPA